MFTKYKITPRDHNNKAGFFIVKVPEAKQLGIGFQFNFRGTLYGISIVHEGSKGERVKK